MPAKMLKWLLIHIFLIHSIFCQDAPAQMPFFANSDPMMSKLSQIQFADAPTLKGDKYPDVDAHRIIAPIISPIMEVFDQMKENQRARDQAEKIRKDREDHPLSTSRSLWEMFQRLQRPTTTTTEAPPLIERLFKPYIEPWQKQLDDFSKDMAGITLIPTTTTTPAPTTTTTPNFLEKSLSMFFPSLRRKPQSIPTLPPTTTPTPRLFDPEMFDRLFFKRDKRQATIAPAPKFDIFTVPPPPPLFQEWEKPILSLSNPFTLNPLMKMFTTPSPPQTLAPLPKIPEPNPYEIKKGLPEPQFKLQDPFYNPLFPSRKSKMFDFLAGGEAGRLLG
ncbi:Osmotic avoidance abnormal protein 8 [Caenorhabditis elegans]|uniref:Osmotic avoidance abnormal protein 8 n=1 Tax=Caenorhabditis elegans TaxID=6239 RepID=OSM8_CAEEL|nr:Osmotic avoidance abnormal protein 8 [Caenorhabditis elegans]Q09423.2 RecName: Full=Osmotic avoidance abnormal protein 8; Flags: Precursor [Caenorhabditis elegans]CCD70517.2 Osmotic avoidance abnormal protein 8 [Caenorhabditis elegans]|eukprot:NP_495595.2 Osmotic avoidance abnormal protein 8 [Caenorhabditis elegans]